MARKTYSEHEREQVREALLTTALQCIVDRGLIHSSIEVLCRKVGISKSFFYTFFASKEELVLEAASLPAAQAAAIRPAADGGSRTQLAGRRPDLFGGLRLW